MGTKRTKATPKVEQDAPPADEPEKITNKTPSPPSIKKIGGSGYFVWDMTLIERVAMTSSTFTVNDEDYTKKMAAIALRSFEPADAVEGMLAAQAVALHYAFLDCSRRAMLQGQPGEIASRLRKDAANSARAMVDMTEAIQRRRGKGTQQVVRVERVIVNEGGQAVVGHVAAGAPLPAAPPAPAAIGHGAPLMAMLDAVPVEVGEGVPHVRSID